MLGGRVGKSFNDLDCSYRIVGLAAALERVKGGEPSVTLTDVSWEGRWDVSLQPVPGDRGEVGAVLLTAVDRSAIAIVQNEREALQAEHAWLVAEHQAYGEELQTLNEELTSANDELQRVNEALAGTNAELSRQVQSLAVAEGADARKNEFLAMLAHELRNPLAAVVNALHVIKKVVPADRQVSMAVRIAERQLRHEARLLDDLLDVSRIVLGKISLQVQPVDLRACTRSALEAIDFTLQSQALHLALDLPDTPVIVAGDGTRLTQCVGNLLSNAAKFSSPGGRIDVSVRADGADAVVTVRDSGIGIAPEMIARVFELFVQGDSSLARGRGGLGIGLTLVQRLVTLHGGSVAARSDGAGRGSEFEIRLPLRTGAVEVPDREASASAARPRRVLIVEDSVEARQMLRLVLEMAGHVVWETGDGAAAVRLAAKHAPEVVLVDIGLPDVDGFEVARRIRRRLGHSVRVVGLSGYGDGEARRLGQQAGFDAHLVKPVSADTLLETIGSL